MIVVMMLSDLSSSAAEDVWDGRIIGEAHVGNSSSTSSKHDVSVETSLT